MADQENELIKAAQRGDVESFERLVKGHQDKLFRLVLALAGNAEDAEDALQETLLQVYRALPGFRGDSSFSTWLYRIAVNRTRNWIRAQSRASSERIGERIAAAGAESSPGIDEELIRRERRQELRQALLKLPEHYRRTILLRHYLDLPYEEIAEILAVPVGTVRSRLAQGRLLLMKTLTARSLAPNRETEALR